MLLNIVIAAILMVVTTAIHAGGMILSMQQIRHQEQRGQHTQIYRVSGVLLLMFMSVISGSYGMGYYLSVNRCY